MCRVHEPCRSGILSSTGGVSDRLDVPSQCSNKCTGYTAPEGQVFGGKVVFRCDDCSSGLGASDLTRVAKLVVAGWHARHSCSQHLRVRPPAGEAIPECRYPPGARIPFRLH